MSSSTPIALLIALALSAPPAAAAVERPQCYQTARTRTELEACYRSHVELLRKAVDLQEQQLADRWLEAECDGKPVVLNDDAQKAAEASNSIFHQMLRAWRSYVDLHAAWIASRPAGRNNDLDAYAYGIAEYQKMVERLKEQSYRQTDCGVKKEE